MIYRFEHKDFRIRQDVDFSRLEVPNNRFLSCEDGLPGNFEYFDARGISWVDFDRCYREEKKLLKKVDAVTKTAEEFDKLMGELDFDASDVGVDSLFLYGFESGIASISAALSAVGCVPFSSCRGHPNKVTCEHAYSVFFVKKKTARELLDLVKGSTSVGLVNVVAGDYQGLNLYAADCITLLDFSKKMRDRFKGRN